MLRFTNRKCFILATLIFGIANAAHALKRVDRYNSSQVFVSSSNSIGNCSANAGETCYVYNDEYDEAVACRSGSEGSPVTYTAFYSSSPATVRRFDCTSDKFVTISNFIITNSSAPFTADANPSFTVTTSTGVIIENNWIHDTTGLGVRANNASLKAHRLTVRNNIFEHIGGITKAITALTMVSSGTLYTPGTYTNGGAGVPLTGGFGDGNAEATSVVVNAGGFVTAINLPAGGTGLGYRFNALISVDNVYLGGVGSGVSYQISNIDGRATAFQVYATSAVYENNDLSYVNDCFVVFGDYIVIRNNVCHDSIIGDASSNQHLDFVQSFPTSFSNTTTASHLMIEGNANYNILGAISTGSGEGSHFDLVNGALPADSTNWITRYNLAHDLSASFIIHDKNPSANSMTMEKHNMYNNTIVRTTLGGTNHNAITLTCPTDSSLLNNLVVDGITGGAPFSGFTTTSGYYKSSNLFYQTSGSLAWSAEASTQKNPILNKDPFFVQGSSIVANQSYYLTSASTNAIDAGVRLSTAVGSGSGSVTLVTTDSGMFQDGWAGVTPDCIAVGTTSNMACIVSIDDATDTITLATALTWNDGDPIWLYSNTTGTRVLYGSGVDLGAFEYNPETGNRISINGGVTITGRVSM